MSLTNPGRAPAGGTWRKSVRIAAALKAKATPAAANFKAKS